MKILSSALLFILSFIFSHPSFGHEGHNNTPGTFKSLHGGTVLIGKETNIEVIVNGTEINIYPTSHESKDLLSSQIKIAAMAKPKKGASYPIALAPMKIGFKAKVDLKGANRLPVEINVTNEKSKTDKFTIQVEEYN